MKVTENLARAVEAIGQHGLTDAAIVAVSVNAYSVDIQIQPDAFARMFDAVDSCEWVQSESCSRVRQNGVEWCTIANRREQQSYPMLRPDDE